MLEPEPAAPPREYRWNPAKLSKSDNHQQEPRKLTRRRRRLEAPPARDWDQEAAAADFLDVLQEPTR